MTMITYELSLEEVDLLRDCIAGELARLLVLDLDANQRLAERFKMTEELGRAMGMDL